MNKTAAILALLNNSYRFRVQCSPKEAKEVLSQFSPYSGIPANIADIVESVQEAVGPCQFQGEGQKNNPNNGTFCNLDFEIGNEGSLVIYVMARPHYNDVSPEVVKRKLEEVGRRFRADENNLHSETWGIKWRMWWD